MKEYLTGYYVANIEVPVPSKIYLNSILGLNYLLAEVESILELNSVYYISKRELRKQLGESIRKEDFELANDLLKSRNLRVFSVRIENYIPEGGESAYPGNQTSLF